MKKYKMHIIWVLVAIVALVGGFFWGKATAQSSHESGSYAGALGSSTRRTAGGSFSGGGLLTGQITAMDSTSITLQLPTGSSAVVFYSTSTPVSEPTMVPVSDLSVGTNVMVGGIQNSDGSYTATTIQVRPAAGSGAAGGYGGQSGAAAGSGTGAAGQ
jgi:hypothetical protein